MFGFLTALRTEITGLKNDAEAAYAALSQLIDLAINGPTP